jgi:Tfp pilus assembly protein PilV
MMRVLSKAQWTRVEQRGASIVEALIAGLVLSFAMVALTGMQVSLSRSADVAKQRTEATRLAQEKMEELRSFQSLPTVTDMVTYDGMISSVSPDAINLVNTDFSRSWTIDNVTQTLGKRIQVSVAWTDRAGQVQTVSIQSMLTKAEHSKLGVIMASGGGSGGGSPPGGESANVPYPAIDIGNGRSTYQWPGNSYNVWYVFSNTDASVLYRCSTQPTSATDLAATCASIRGYIVAGYISVDVPNGNNANRNIDTELSPWVVDRCGIDAGTRVNVGADNALTTNVDEGAPCFVANIIVGNAINPACPYFETGGNNNPSGAEIDELRFYKCYAALVELANPNVETWSGRMTFLTAPTGSRKICRFVNNLNNNNTGVYNGVRQSLNNENYFARLNNNCETGQAQHQP